MSEREAFEAWLVDRWGDRSGLLRQSDGDYQGSTVQFAWKAWLARAARAKVQP